MQHVVPAAVGVVHVVDVQVVPARGGTRGDAVRRHLADADDPGQRGRADLDLVEPHQHVVERADHLVDVERHRGDRPGADMAVHGQQTAPQHGAGDRQQVAELDRREPAQPQTERVALRVVAVAQRLVEPAVARLAQRQGVDGAGAVDGLGDDAVEAGVGGPLPQVALAGVPQVAAGGEPEERHAEQHRQRDQRRGGNGRDHRHDDRHRRRRRSTGCRSAPRARAPRRRWSCGRRGRRCRRARPSTGAG